MAKIQRKTQKIFAGSTTSDQITAFGTAKSSNPIYTTDLDAIQTTIYTQGWTPSLMSDLAPYLQDSNALWFLATSQLAYLFQQGIAEWDAGTEYTQGSLVSKYNNGEMEIYMSLQNNNIGNQLSESTYWKKYEFKNFDLLINEIDNLKDRTFTSYIANVGNGTTNLYQYLPNDGNIYIVWLFGYKSAQSGAAYVNSDIFPSTEFLRNDGDSGRASQDSNIVTIPVGTGRTISVSGVSSASLRGYSKL